MESKEAVVLPNLVPTPLPDRSYTAFDLTKRNEILDLYIEGKSLNQISQMPDMPSLSTMLRWIRDSQKMATEFERARVARAINLEEKALEIAEGSIDKDDAPGERLRFDIYKWGAEVSDPNKYGKKITVAGDKDRPVVFKIVTNVPDPTEFQKQPELDAQGMVIQKQEALPAPEKSDDIPTAPEKEPETLFERLQAHPYDPCGEKLPPGGAA